MGTNSPGPVVRALGCKYECDEAWSPSPFTSSITTAQTGSARALRKIQDLRVSQSYASIYRLTSSLASVVAWSSDFRHVVGLDIVLRLPCMTAEHRTISRQIAGLKFEQRSTEGVYVCAFVRTKLWVHARPLSSHCANDGQHTNITQSQNVPKPRLFTTH